MTAQNQEPKETIITEKIEKKENERFKIRSEMKWNEKVCFEIGNFKETNVAHHVNQHTLLPSLNYAEISNSLFITQISKLSMATAFLNN